MYKNCVFLESPIVNKFKKTMTLYHATSFYKGNKVLKPMFVSAGNKLEPGMGPSIFFFSKHQYALNYLLGSVAYSSYKKYLTNYIESVNKYADPEERDDFMEHFEFMKRYGLDVTSPLSLSLSYDARVYHVDDREYCMLPVCYNFKEYLNQQKNYKVYIYECEVETSKIKHGHSKDFQEFTVFEPVPVKKVHQYNLSELISKVDIKTVPFDKARDYITLLNGGNRKDFVRGFIAYDDWSERRRNYRG